MKSNLSFSSMILAARVSEVHTYAAQAEPVRDVVAWPRSPISRWAYREWELRGAEGLKGGLLCTVHGSMAVLGRWWLVMGVVVLTVFLFFASRPVLQPPPACLHFRCRGVTVGDATRNDLEQAWSSGLSSVEGSASTKDKGPERHA